MSPLPLRRWPNTGEISSYSDSSSEYESSSELQLDPVHSFPLPWNPQGDDVFLKAGNVDPELSKTGCQQPLGCSSQSLGKPKAREVSSEADSSSDDERSSESFQSLDEFEEFLESVSFINDSVSEEKVASRRYSQALLESEENELSTESSSYFEKYYSSDDMSSSEEEQPPEPSKQALGQDRDQQEVLPVSNTQQQPPILGNVSVAQSRPVESLPPGHTVSSWVSSQSEHQVLAEGNAADWNICMQPPIKPVLEQDISAGPELGVSEECVPPQSPIFPSQPSGGPNIKKEVSLGAESVALEGSHFMELLPLQQPSQPRQASAFERGLSMDSKLPAQSFQPWMKPQGKQSFSGSEITAFEGNSSMEHVPPSLSQPMKQPYQNVPLESEAVAAKIITMGPLHTKYSTHSLLTPPSQPVSESTSVEGASLCPSQPWLTPTFEQISVLPGNVPAAWAIPIHPQSPRMPFQPLMGSQITVEPLPPRNPLQPWPTSPFEQISTLPDKAAKAVWNIPVDPLPRMLSWPLMGSVVQQPVSTELVSVSVPQSSSAELMPYRVPFQSRVDVETYSADEGVSATMRPGRHHSQPPISTEFKEEVSSDSLGASGEWGIPIEPMPSKYAPHPWLGPEFECIAKEGDICKEAWPPRNPSQSIIEHQAQKTPLPSKVPTPFLMSSKIKDMSSSLENADNQDSSKKQQGKSAPAESFVKFMADQIFAGSTAGETAIYGKPVLRSRSRPSRSLLKPKLEESDLFYNWDDKPKEDTTSKKLSQKQPPQSPGRPKESQEILSYSKGAPVTWSSSAVDSSQPLKVSVSVSFPEEWKRSEGQLPSTQPSQGFDVARSQPPVLSTASANAPVEWISPEGHPPPKQVYLGSASATTEGTISRKNSGSWAMPKGPDSTKKTMEYTQGCGDFLKGTPTSVTKLGKFTSVPAQKAFASAGASSKKEVLRRSSFLSTSKSKVENVFGVRLRKISQRSGMENPEPMAPVVPAGKDQTNKETPQGSSAGQETSSQAFSSAEKQENRPRYEGTSKKPTVFRPPGESFSLQLEDL
ncbi:Acrosomal protein KIAA1210 [Lemmus lemmus]